MKRTKLLWASPLLIAPIAATIPMITSCSNKTVNVSSELTKYADIKTSNDGDTYYVSMSIKDEYKGTQFLPSELTKVKTGDKELTPVEEANAVGDYYEYITYESNQKALLIVNEYQGSIQVEGSASTLKSIAVTGVDITESGIAEFEVGETFENDTARVAVEGTLNNGDTFDIDNSLYTIKLGEFEEGHTFTDDDITEEEETGTVICGNQSNTFTYKVIETVATVTSFRKTYISKPTYTKASSIEDAIDAYNEATTETEYDGGVFTIGIIPREEPYVIEDDITIYEVDDTDLIIEALDYSPEYGVTLQGTVSSDVNCLFDIEPIEEFRENKNGTVTISGITFDEPKAKSGTTGETFSDIYIGSGVQVGDACEYITISDCSFYGNSENTNTVNAIKTEEPEGLFIYDCYGMYLNTLLTGSVNHNANYAYDFSIIDSNIFKSKQLFDVTSGDEAIRALIGNTTAYLMWDPTGSASTVTQNGAMKITGCGEYKFLNCSFTQLTKVASATGWIEIGKPEESTASNSKNVVFNYCELTKKDNDTNLSDIYNNAKTSEEDWKITWTDLTGSQEGTVEGDLESESKSWSHS